jgi:hypothetical protein
MSVLTLKWEKLRDLLKEQFGRKPDLQSTLFLIGVDDVGKGAIKYSKEEKQDLIHVGICKVLTYSNYYVLQGRDEDGWPHYEKMNEIPKMNLIEQEELLRAHVIHHFEELELI